MQCRKRGIPAAMSASRDFQLRRTIFESFASAGAPPQPDEDLSSLAERHWIVLDDAGRIVMAHPFAAHTEGARVDAGGRTWWGNCAWDGLGIVAALKLAEATVTAQGITASVSGDAVSGDAVFHVLVPARRWWDDIGFT